MSFPTIFNEVFVYIDGREMGSCSVNYLERYINELEDELGELDGDMDLIRSGCVYFETVKKEVKHEK